MVPVMMEIWRESKLLLVADLPRHIFMTLLLIFPVSSISLTHVLMSKDMAWRMKKLLLSGSVLQQGRVGGEGFVIRSLLEQVAQAMATAAMAAPLEATLMMGAKVGVWMVARRRAEGVFGGADNLKLEEAVEEGAGMWGRMAATYVWGAAMVAAAAALWVNLAAAAANLAALGVNLAALGMNLAATLLFVGFLPLLVASLRLSIAIAGLHPSGSLWGPSAIASSFSLLLRHRCCRLGPALLLFVLPSSATAMAEYAFHALVVRNPTTSALAMAPLFIFLHALVQLLDVILCYAFFARCYEEAGEEDDQDEDGVDLEALTVDEKPAAAAAAPSSLLPPPPSVLA